MDDTNTSDVVHLGFAKVFDSVNHRFLLAKLELFVLYEKVVRWIRSYWTRRTYRVQVADVLSQETRIRTWWLPHGSVTGFFLFLQFVNDLPSAINELTLLFVDDDVKMV